MQLFGLVNTLLQKDPETFKRHLTIVKYPVIPLSPNSGLLGWVQSTDTLHVLIKNYRDSRKILLNIEHRLILQVSFPRGRPPLCSCADNSDDRWLPTLSISASCRSSKCSSTRSTTRQVKTFTGSSGSRVEIRKHGSTAGAITVARLQSCRWSDTFSVSEIAILQTCSWTESVAGLSTSTSVTALKSRCNER